MVFSTSRCLLVVAFLAAASVALEGSNFFADASLHPESSHATAKPLVRGTDELSDPGASGEIPDLETFELLESDARILAAAPPMHQPTGNHLLLALFEKGCTSHASGRVARWCLAHSTSTTAT